MPVKKSPAKQKPSPAAQCPVCGSRDALLLFEATSLPLRVGELAGQVEGLSGQRCRVCDEVFLDDASAQAYSDAGDALVLAARKAEGAKLRRARLSLGLSQEAAGLLAGGGHNGFSRYENGLAEPVPAVANLFRLLEKHPLLAAELPGVTVRLLKNSAVIKKGGKALLKDGQRIVIEVGAVPRLTKPAAKPLARKNTAQR